MIYLNNAAGTKVFPEVVETITDMLTNHWGNPHDDSEIGHNAMNIIHDVTQQVADDINCNPEEIIWTSGACEANSLALCGFMSRWFTRLYVSKLEHTSINEIVQHTTYEHVIYFIENNTDGSIVMDDLKYRLKYDKEKFGRSLVSISFANSEIGVIQNIKAIADVVHSYGGVLHVDATQMYPWMKIDVQELGIDLMSVSGQKLNCCKGIGFLYARDGVEFDPLIYGSQQGGRRGGTLPTHLISAFGTALKITRERNQYDQVKHLRDRLLSQLLLIDGVYLNGPGVDDNRLPNNISLTVDGVKAETLVTLCDMMGIVIAKGSACKSYDPKPSETLLAIGLTEEQALNTVRISLGIDTTLEEINKAAEIITKMVKRIRENN